VEHLGALDLYDLGAPPAGRLSSAHSIIAQVTGPPDPGAQVELRALAERVPRVAGSSARDSLVVLREVQPPVGQAGNRVVWRSSVGPAAASVRDDGTHPELRASYTVDKTPNSALVRTFSQLRVVDADRGLPIPRLVGRVPREHGLLYLDVIDPSARIVYCDLKIGVRPRVATSYYLTVDGRGVARLDSPATVMPVWLQFPRVRLLPGRNQLVLSTSSVRFASIEPLLPPRALTGGAFEPYAGQVEFIHIHPESGPALTSVARAMRRIGLDLDVRLKNGATLLLNAAPGEPGHPSLWVVGVRLKNIGYQCAERIDDGLPVDLRDTVRQCFEGTGTKLDADDIGHLTITSLWLVTGPAGEPTGVAPFATLSLSSRVERPVLIRISGKQGTTHFTLGPSGSSPVVESVPSGIANVAIAARDSDISNLIAGAAPAHQSEEMSLPIAAAFSGFYATRVADSGLRLVMIREVYDPSWIALAMFPGIRVLPHLEVDGWRNGWYVDRGGLIVALNGLVVFQLAFAVVAVVVLVMLWRSAR
jgi:hypothetical protein